MKEAAANLEFEEAARLRDEIRRLEDGRARRPSRSAKRRRPPAAKRGSRRVAVEPTSARPPRPRAAPAAAPAPEPGRLPYGGAWLGPRARAYLRLLDHRLVRLRALLRADELAFVALAALVGAAAGVAVAVMSRATQLAARAAVRDPRGQHLSAPAPASSPGGCSSCRSRRLAARPRHVAERPLPLAAGGRPDRGQRAAWRPDVAARQPRRRAGDDDLERRRRLGRARGRLHPGRLGHRLRARPTLRLRRSDLRILVGCGAAGAIGAAFDAPLTGAFYAFELVIGGYTVAALAPVVASASPAPAGGRCAGGRDSTSMGIVRAPCATGDDQSAAPGARRSLAALAGIVLMLGVDRDRARCCAACRAALRCGRRSGGLCVGGLGAALRRRCCRPAMARSTGLLEAPLPLREIALVLLVQGRWPRRSRSAPAFAAVCSSPRCSWARCSARCSPASCRPAAALAEPDPQACALIGMSSMAVARRRRAADDGLPGAGDDRRFRAGAALIAAVAGPGADRPAPVRLSPSPPGASICAARRSAARTTSAGSATSPSAG